MIEKLVFLEKLKNSHGMSWLLGILYETLYVRIYLTRFKLKWNVVIFYVTTSGRVKDWKIMISRVVKKDDEGP